MQHSRGIATVDKRPALIDGETEFGLFLSHMELEQHIDDAMSTLGLGIYSLEQLQGVDAVNHRHEWHNHLHLIGLQVPDKVPLHVGRHERMLLSYLLSAVFAKEPL